MEEVAKLVLQDHLVTMQTKPSDIIQSVGFTLYIY